MNKKLYLPIIIFVGLIVFLAIGLTLDPSKLPSPLVGKPLPAFSLPTLADANRSFSTQDQHGKKWLLNIWATWCVSCRDEHEVLLNLAQEQGVEIIGLNYKDDLAEAKRWLERLGDPYRVVPVDQVGRTGINLGVYGLPETFIIDAQGQIIDKHVGPVTPQVVADKILPALL